MSSGIPPTNPNQPTQPSSHEPANQASGSNPFARLLPGASPQEIQKFTSGFINFTIQQMKQDQQNMLDAIKKMQEDQDN